MVVKSIRTKGPRLDLGYLAFFLGLRINQLVLERLHAAGYRNARESHGYVIQHLIEQERSITELAQRMEVSQQAASKVVAELARLGMLEMVPGPDRRSKSVRISPNGWKVVQLGRKFRRQIEDELIRSAGKESYEQAAAILTGCLAELGGMEQVRLRRVRPPQ